MNLHIRTFSNTPPLKIVVPIIDNVLSNETASTDEHINKSFIEIGKESKPFDYGSDNKLLSEATQKDVRIPTSIQVEIDAQSMFNSNLFKNPINSFD